MTPKQRGAGQTGNTGWGHRSNRVKSTRRGGNPHAGGGGSGRKPPGGGLDCGLVVILGAGGLATLSGVLAAVIAAANKIN